MTQRVSITYAYDAYCGWCYGFSPALHEFVEANADRVTLRVISGGLFTGSRVAPISSYPHIPDAVARITELTGVSFGDPFLEVLRQGSAVMDSVDAAAGLAALRRRDRDVTLTAAEALQRAWFLDGRSLSDEQVYRDTAAALGLDADAVARDYTDPRIRAEARADFDQTHRLGVTAYPTLILHTNHGNHPLGDATCTSQDLSAALDRYLR